MRAHLLTVYGIPEMTLVRLSSNVSASAPWWSFVLPRIETGRATSPNLELCFPSLLAIFSSSPTASQNLVRNSQSHPSCLVAVQLLPQHEVLLLDLQSHPLDQILLLSNNVLLPQLLNHLPLLSSLILLRPSKGLVCLARWLPLLRESPINAEFWPS